MDRAGVSRTGNTALEAEGKRGNDPDRTHGNAGSGPALEWLSAHPAGEARRERTTAGASRSQKGMEGDPGNMGGKEATATDGDLQDGLGGIHSRGAAPPYCPCRASLPD